jgi:hypothetical protein
MDDSLVSRNWRNFTRQRCLFPTFCVSDGATACHLPAARICSDDTEYRRACEAAGNGTAFGAMQTIAKTSKVLKAEGWFCFDRRCRHGVGWDSDGAAGAITFEIAGAAKLIDRFRTEPKPFGGFGNRQIFIGGHIGCPLVFSWELMRKRLSRGSTPKSGLRP